MSANDTHHTGGEHYRTPAHPGTLAALGRAIWNFLYLEESVVAILYEAGEYTLGDARALDAGGKERALRQLRSSLEAREAPPELLDSLDSAIAAFSHARSEHRNALAHASPHTAGYDEDGKFRPGLALDLPGGRRLHAATPGHLLEIAHRIEDAATPLAAARRAIREYVGWGQ